MDETNQLHKVLQVARQEGQYLAHTLKKHQPSADAEGDEVLPRHNKPFKYTHLGSLAYVGADKAVMDIPKMGPITGWTAGQSASQIADTLMDSKSSGYCNPNTSTMMMMMKTIDIANANVNANADSNAMTVKDVVTMVKQHCPASALGVSLSKTACTTLSKSCLQACSQMAC